MIDEVVCWKCGASLDDVPRPLSRYQPCRRCGADLYVCRMCLHFDPRLRDGCREERAETPRSREAANFCDWFKPRANAFQSEATESRAARDALTALFGEGEAGPANSSPSDALKDLFSEKPKSKE